MLSCLCLTFLGVTVGAKMDVFLEKVRKGGGGVISDPKNYIADFVGFKAVYFGKKAQCNFHKRTGGGVKAVWKFSKKTSIFGPTVTPYYYYNIASTSCKWEVPLPAQW